MTGQVLVTGATGFLGKHLSIHLLSQGYRVSALKRADSPSTDTAARLAAAGVEFLGFRDSSEVRDLARQSGADTVYHLATHYLKNHRPEDVPTLIEANISLGANLFEGFRETGAAVVSAMSFFQFREGVPTPYSLYSATKQAFLDLSDYYREVAGLDVTQVILYDTFGPRDTRDKLLPHLMASLRRSLPVSLGPSAQPIDLLFVDDVVTGLVAASLPGTPPTVSLRADRVVTVGEVVDTIREVTGLALPVTFNEEGEVSDTVLTSGDWPPPGGWSGGRSLRAGLTATWQSLY